VRDLTEKQFRDALKRHGMTLEGVLGYVNIGIPEQHISVSMLNGGFKFRSRLAYLLREKDKWEKRLEAEASTKVPA
jgi:hypothetical protein